MKVRIQNFQSLADVSLEIKGFTAIVGKSNIGKSAIVRAVKGALCNAEGTDFVRTGTSHSEVHLEHDGLDLTWRKGANVNDYEVNGDKLTKVGRGAPEPLKDAGFREITTNTGRLSLFPQVADQFFPIFLLNQSGAAVSEVISDVSRLDTIQKALKACEKDRKSANSTKKVREQDVQIADRRLEDFAALDEALEGVQRVSDLAMGVHILEAEIVSLEGYERRLEQLAGQIKDLAGASDIQIPIWNGLDTLTTEIEIVERFKSKADRLATGIRELRGVTAVILPDPDILADASGDIHTVLAFQQKVLKIEGEIKELIQKTKDSTKEVNSASKAINIIMRDLKMCPTCDQEFPDDSISDHAH